MYLCGVLRLSCFTNWLHHTIGIHCNRFTWQLHSATFNRKNGDCIVYDERGQIYFLSIKQNIYRTVRLASTPISAMTYVSSKSSQIITAYENGDIMLLESDSSSDVINMTVQCPSLGVSPVRIIRTHPTQPLAAMASDDGAIILWDFR